MKYKIHDFLQNFTSFLILKKEIKWNLHTYVSNRKQVRSRGDIDDKMIKWHETNQYCQLPPSSHDAEANI